MAAALALLVMVMLQNKGGKSEQRHRGNRICQRNPRHFAKGHLMIIYELYMYLQGGILFLGSLWGILLVGDCRPVAFFFFL